MSISEEYSAYLEDLFVLTESHSKINSWERKFLDDMKERYEQHGNGMFVSPKQKNILCKIEAKIGE